MARLAAAGADDGLDLVTVAPMYALAWWADHGLLEPVAELAKQAVAARRSNRNPRQGRGPRHSHELRAHGRRGSRLHPRGDRWHDR